MRERYQKLVPATWQKLIILGQKQGAMKLHDLALEIGLPEAETLTFVRQLFPNGGGLEIYYQDKECWIDINAEALQYMLPLSPGEWLELHQILQFAEVQMPLGDGLKSLKRKVLDNGPIKIIMDLLHRLDHWDEKLNEKQQNLLKVLEPAIEGKQMLQLGSRDGKKYSSYPLKILHLEGQLSLISEDAQDHCLMVMPLREIDTAEAVGAGAGARVTTFEIEEFITAVRAMNEKETRLILKIHDPQEVNLFPNHHFLGKPCMITNPEGELIWAAYVEPCADLFDWLMELDKNVEILDPIGFKEEYLSYCREKLRKIA
jgi:hypothetical protein